MKAVSLTFLLVLVGYFLLGDPHWGDPHWGDPHWALACFPLVAMGLDTLWGEPPARVHPVCFVGKFAVYMEKVWRSLAGNGFGAGLGAALCVILPCAGGVTLLVFVAGKFGLGVQYALATGCVFVCLAPRSLGEHATRVMEPLRQGNVEAARAAVSMLVGRDTAALNAHGIGRACVESVGENLTDGVLSTLFWAGAGAVCGFTLASATANSFTATSTAASSITASSIAATSIAASSITASSITASSIVGQSLALTLGAGGAVLHRVCNVLDALWGKRNARYARFGTCAARLDDVLNFVPARLSLPVIALACLCCTTHEARAAARGTRVSDVKGSSNASTEALRVGWHWRKAHASPNSPWSEAAFAGALGLKLGGPVCYKGMDAPYPYMGDGTLEVTPWHIERAVALMVTSSWLFALVVSVAIAVAVMLGGSFSS